MIDRIPTQMQERLLAKSIFLNCYLMGHVPHLFELVELSLFIEFRYLSIFLDFRHNLHFWLSLDE